MFYLFYSDLPVRIQVAATGGSPFSRGSQGNTLRDGEAAVPEPAELLPWGDGPSAILQAARTSWGPRSNQAHAQFISFDS